MAQLRECNDHLGRRAKNPAKPHHRGGGCPSWVEPGAKFLTSKTLHHAIVSRYGMPDMAGESVSSTVERRMKRRPGRLFTYADFDDLPATAVAPALSRLRARGDIRRASKGIYFVPRWTVLGEVPADPVVVGDVVSRGRSHLAGLTAANALGLTTQVPARVELAVEDRRLTSPLGVAFTPRMGTNRRGLHRREAALLEVLRDLNHLTDLSPEDTTRKLGALLADDSARNRIRRAAVHEPPRVRAMVGALAEQAGASEDELRQLRKTLNPTTRYDFGPLSELGTARNWRAR